MVGHIQQVKGHSLASRYSKADISVPTCYVSLGNPIIVSGVHHETCGGEKLTGKIASVFY